MNDHALLLRQSASTESEYTVVKTPRSSTLHDNVVRLQSVNETCSHRTSTTSRIFVQLAQVLVVSATAVCVLGQLLLFTDVYSRHVKVALSRLWDVPKAQALVPDGMPIANPKGHAELVHPTFVLLFFAVPLLASLLVVEFLRSVAVRRVTATYAQTLGHVLRRKPSAFARVSPLSYGELLFLIGVLIGGNVFVFCVNYDRRRSRTATAPTRSESITMVAAALGFNCLYNLAFLFLPATRNSPWMEFLNISYANGVAYHRWLGVATVVTALAHSVAYMWVWVRKREWREHALPCFDCALSDRASKQVWMTVFGELALLCFLVITVTSVPVVRRRLYNVFYYVHHLFALAVVFAVLHWAPSLWWLYPALTLYLAHRTLSSANAFTPVLVTACSRVSDGLVKVVLARSATPPSGDYKVGQFVYLNVPAISKLQWHAFTIASSPKTSARVLTVLIKVRGDWTRALAQHVGDCKKDNVLPTVFMDGYYGASLEMYDEYSTVCLIGGGIGVTPLFAILEDMVAKLSHHETPSQRVFFIFTFRELALLEEIHPLLAKIKELDPQEKFFSFHFSLTRTPSEEKLDEPLDHERLGGKSHVLATQYSTEITKKTPVPFAEPLRTRGTRSFAFVAVFAVSFVLLAVLECGSGAIAGTGRERFWMLQQVVEVAALSLSAIGIIAAFVFAERYCLLQRRTSTSALSKSQSEEYDVATHGAQNYISAIASSAHLGREEQQLRSYRDLVQALDVTIGERLDILKILTHVAEETSCVMPPMVGVFVSGPKTLVDATECAVATLGASRFDIHTEAFEL